MKNKLTLITLLFLAIVANGQTKHELPNIPPNLASPSTTNLTIPRVSQGASVSQIITDQEFMAESYSEVLKH